MPPTVMAGSSMSGTIPSEQHAESDAGGLHQDVTLSTTITVQTGGGRASGDVSITATDKISKPDGTFVSEVLIAPDTLRGSVMDLELSVDSEQRFMYVADGRNSKIWILRRRDLELVGSFGHAGHQAGAFTLAHSLAVDSKGNLYVGENLEGKRVQKFMYQGR